MDKHNLVIYSLVQSFRNQKNNRSVLNYLHSCKFARKPQKFVVGVAALRPWVAFNYIQMLLIFIHVSGGRSISSANDDDVKYIFFFSSESMCR